MRLAYRYTYEQNGQPQTIWFGSEASLLNRLQLAEPLQSARCQH